MPYFTLHRNFTLRTTKSHVIRFQKDEKVWVPPVCVPDAVAVGAQPVDDDTVDVIGEEPKVMPALTPAQRKEKMFDAFKLMIARNERNDFTASGSPNAKKLVPLVGFDMSTKERDEAWIEFRQLEQERAEQA